MRSSILFVLMLSVVAVPAAQATGFDACSLLTSEEVEAVQGETIVSYKSTTRASGGFLRSQCYFTLPTHTRSISLEVTRRDPESTDSRSPKDLWRDLFQDPGAWEGGKEKEGVPQEVAGVGDGAFWSGNAMVGALYVLKNDAYLRVSIGGAGGTEERIEKTTRLARAAVERLQRRWASLMGATDPKTDPSSPLRAPSGADFVENPANAMD
jgi:hypothetical protein